MYIYFVSFRHEVDGRELNNSTVLGFDSQILTNDDIVRLENRIRKACGKNLAILSICWLNPNMAQQ